MRNALIIAHDPATGTPVANDGVSVQLKADDAAGTASIFVQLDAVIVDAAAATKDGRLDVKTLIAGTLGTAMSIGGHDTHVDV